MPQFGFRRRPGGTLKRWLAALSIAGLLVALVAPAPVVGATPLAADTCAGTWNIAGTWTIAQSNGVTISVTFTQQDAAVSGTAQSGPVSGKVSAGSVSGNNLDFTVAWQTTPAQTGRYVLQLPSGAGSTVDVANPNRPTAGVQGKGPVTCPSATAPPAPAPAPSNSTAPSQLFDPSSVSDCQSRASDDPRTLGDCLFSRGAPSNFVNVVLTCYQPLLRNAPELGPSGDAFQDCLTAAQAWNSPPASAGDCWTQATFDPHTLQVCLQQFGAGDYRYIDTVLQCFQPALSRLPGQSAVGPGSPLTTGIPLPERPGALQDCLSAAQAWTSPPVSASDCWTQATGDPFKLQTCLRQFGATDNRYLDAATLCYEPLLLPQPGQSGGNQVPPLQVGLPLPLRANAFQDCLNAAQSWITPPASPGDCWTKATMDPLGLQTCLEVLEAGDSRYINNVVACFQPFVGPLPGMQATGTALKDGIPLPLRAGALQSCMNKAAAPGGT